MPIGVYDTESRKKRAMGEPTDTERLKYLLSTMKLVTVVAGCGVLLLILPEIKEGQSLVEAIDAAMKESQDA